MNRKHANLMLLLAAVLWGSGNVAQQTVLAHVGPLTANGLKCLIASAVILPFCRGTAAKARKLGWSGWGWAIAVIISFAVASTLMQMGVGQTTVTNAGFLVNATTVFTPLASWLMLYERPRAFAWPAAACAFTGVCLMSGGSPFSLASGDLLCLASAVAYAEWAVFLGAFVTRFGAPGLVTLLQFGATAAICLVLAAFTEPPALKDVLDAGPELALLGVFSTALAYFLQAEAQRHTSAGEAALVVSTEAIFGAIAAMVALDEQPSISGIAGAGLIIGGIVVVEAGPMISRVLTPAASAVSVVHAPYPDRASGPRFGL